MSNATTFGQQAGTYAKGRPSYPDALFEWIAQNSPDHDCVLDVATGSGQAARSLANHFKHVEATDIDPAQIEAAVPHARITYRVAPATQSVLGENAVDALNVATALHWFAGEPFWSEIARIARPGALFCAYVYDLCRVDGPIQTEALDPLYALLDPYWSEGNRLAMQGYTAENTTCPFPTLPTPSFDAGGNWSAKQLVNFIESWSGHLRARQDGKAEELSQIRDRIIYMAGDTPLVVRLPLSVLAARIN